MGSHLNEYLLVHSRKLLTGDPHFLRRGPDDQNNKIHGLTFLEQLDVLLSSGNVLIEPPELL